jgi:hypothetical protein
MTERKTRCPGDRPRTATVNGSSSTLRFVFTVTLDRPDLSRRFVRVRRPRKPPTARNVEEVGRLTGARPANFTCQLAADGSAPNPPPLD